MADTPPAYSEDGDVAAAARALQDLESRDPLPAANGRRGAKVRPGTQKRHVIPPLGSTRVSSCCSCSCSSTLEYASRSAVQPAILHGAHKCLQLPSVHLVRRHVTCTHADTVSLPADGVQSQYDIWCNTI